MNELFPIEYFYMNSTKEQDFGISAATYNDGRIKNIIGTIDTLGNGFNLNTYFKTIKQFNIEDLKKLLK